MSPRTAPRETWAASSPTSARTAGIVVFMSDASTLVPGDTNGVRDVFVRDRTLGVTELVSVASGGALANSSSAPGAISDDGRFVAFGSFATNLVAGDTNGSFDVFVHDRDTGTTERVSVTTGGIEGDGPSSGVAISGDGSVVAFFSSASNLVPGDTNVVQDVFVHDRDTGVTERVSVSSDEEEVNSESSFSIQGDSSLPQLSFDGTMVSFDSDASNLVPGDGNVFSDSFVRDRTAGTTTRVSVDSAGVEGDEGSSDTGISADGSVVSFISIAANLVPGDTNVCSGFVAGHCPDVFVHDLGQEPPPAGDADVSVSQTDTPDPVRARQQLTYTVAVTNGGPAAATEVTLTDTLPRNIRAGTITTTEGVCSRVARTVTCTIGALDPGETVTVTIRVTPKRAGTLTNTATVDAIENDPDPADNTDLEQTMVTP